MSIKKQAKRVRSSEARRNYEQAENNKLRLKEWINKKAKMK